MSDETQAKDLFYRRKLIAAFGPLLWLVVALIVWVWPARAGWRSFLFMAASLIVCILYVRAWCCARCGGSVKLPWAVLLLIGSSVMLFVVYSLDLFSVVSPPIVGRICARFPRLAWTYGTADMQHMAMYGLEGQIHQGMPYTQVIAILGPGDWICPPPYDGPHAPYDPPRFPLPNDLAVEFNVRDGGCAGFDVHFVGGRVHDFSTYD